MATILLNSPSFAPAETQLKPAYQAQEGLHVALSDATWDAVRNGSQDEGSFFSRIWEAIKEFFTPSDQIEAKNAFLKFYSSESNDQDKLDGFYKLKELAGFGNQELCAPEVSYHAKPDGGFFKFYNLKIKVEGVETPLERHVSADCDEVDEIVKAYSPIIASENDQQQFAKCIKALYASPDVLEAAVEKDPLFYQGLALILAGINIRTPGLGVSIDVDNGLSFRDNKFPVHGSSAIDQSICDLKLSPEIKSDFQAKIESFRPAQISFDQKHEAFQLLSQAMGHSPKDYTKNDHKQVGKLLETVYSRGASFQQKEAALLKLRNQIGSLPGMAFEVSQSTVGSFKGEKGALAEIINLRMVFPGNEKSLKPIEIFNAKLRVADPGKEVGSQSNLMYRPWTAIFAIGAGVQLTHVRAEYSRLAVAQKLNDTSEFFDLEPDGSMETYAQQRLNVSNHSQLSADEPEDIFYDFDVISEADRTDTNSSLV
ncbi:hypothetical protein [Ottowia thiooxydans]|uniref:Uncharacterized protein n=1 Tax=Ottowia thiooxydans TaxID=219182 RepID=A0ABV2QBH8_9BURK